MVAIGRDGAYDNLRVPVSNIVVIITLASLQCFLAGLVVCVSAGLVLCGMGFVPRW
jgi:hypothetical protein